MLRGTKPPGLVGWGFVWGCRLPFSPVFTHLSSFSLDRRGTKTSWLSAWGRRWFGPRSLGQWMFWPHWGPAELLTPWTPPQVAAVLSWELWKLSVLFLQELIQSDKLWGCCSMLVPSLHDFYYLIRVGDGPPFLLQPVDGCISLAVQRWYSMAPFVHEKTLTGVKVFKTELSYLSFFLVFNGKA